MAASNKSRQPLDVRTKPTTALAPHQREEGSNRKYKEEEVPQMGATKLWSPVLGAGFTQALAREIVRNLTSIGQFTTRPRQLAGRLFQHRQPTEKKQTIELGNNPILVDTSVIIDGRILSIVNSGFLVGTLLIPQFVLAEIQHIADSADSLRRTKGRRGLDIVNKLKGQRANPLVKTTILSDDPVDVKEVDHKLIALAKQWKAKQVKLMTVDFNLAHVARIQGVRVLNINDLSQAMKVAIIPGEELDLKLTHEGKEQNQGVGYLPDGTMIVVDHARDNVGTEVTVIITKIHQTPAGQMFFARLR